LLAYKIIGSGKPSCVLIHGFLESSEMWDALSLDLLEISFICIDLPGHGGSSFNGFTNVEKGMEELAFAVIEVLDSLNIHDFNIVGHSLGGYVALEVKRIRKNCKKLVLLNSNYWADSPEKRLERERVASLAKTSKSLFINKAIPSLFTDAELNKKEIAKLINTALDMTPEAISAISIAMSFRKNWQVFKPLKDFYIIHGLLDKMYLEHQPAEMLFSKEQVFKIENVGHMSYIENPIAVSSILQAILSN
jgi:pimeloyl-ACP methyl ester carboxylesterase